MTPEEIQALQDTNKELTERVNQLESINTDLVTQKHDLKQKIEDGVTDEDMKLELTNYKEQLAQVESDKESLRDGYTKELNGLHMMQQLREMGVEAHNSDAMNAVSELVLQDATYKDGSFVFLNSDGTTRFNESNKDFSIQDKINEMKESDKSYLFKAATGGGATDTPSTPHGTNYKDMTAQDKVDYFNKNGSFPQG